MADNASDNRRFRVHARHTDAHNGRVLTEPTFEAAAIAYVEDLHASSGDGEEISIIVRDLDSGHEHCFKLDLATGETSPCG